MTVTIIVAPIASSPGRFMAKLASNGDVLVASSRTPFLDAARRLLELGYAADAEVVTVLDAYGFKDKTILTWDKGRVGTGDYLHGHTEPCIMAERGKQTGRL